MTTGCTSGGDVLREVSYKTLGAAIEVHRHLGPGLLESVYRHCLARELQRSSLRVRQEVPIPIKYKDDVLECGFRADLIVEDSLIVELKAAERLLPMHEAQVLTYLKLT